MEKIYVEDVELSNDMLRVLKLWQHDYGGIIVTELEQLQDFLLENWDSVYEDEPDKVKKFLQLIRELKVDISKFITNS